MHSTILSLSRLIGDIYRQIFKATAEKENFRKAMESNDISAIFEQRHLCWERQAELEANGNHQENEGPPEPAHAPEHDDDHDEDNNDDSREDHNTPHLQEDRDRDGNGDQDDSDETDDSDDETDDASGQRAPKCTARKVQHKRRRQ